MFRPFVLAALVAGLLSTSLDSAAQSSSAPKKPATVINSADRFVMQGGNVVLLRGKQTTPLTQNVRLRNGTKVNVKSGIVEMPGGKLTTLQEGDYVNAQGEIIFATPASAAAARGETAPAEARFEPYVEKGSVSTDVATRLTALSTRLDLMAQKINLLNQKITLLSANAQRPTDTSQLDQQIQQLEQQLQQMK